MRLFASWSGEESKRIAELLKTWIPCVIQDAEVYVSSQDIGKGERWLASVSNNLAEIDFGIIVVTKTNLTAPWILFEAGALSKSVKGVVAPLLCGVENFEAAKSPLTQFQYVRPVADEMRDLMVQVNSFSAKPLDQIRVEAAFAKWWPDFETAYQAIELEDAKPAKKETDATRLQNIEEALGGVMLELRRLRQQPAVQPGAQVFTSGSFRLGSEPNTTPSESTPRRYFREASFTKPKKGIASSVIIQGRNKKGE
ncbi:TIR domain-containing protein [Rhizobium ruizarguesonis]|uniref:TIR domain-containing protein n=1 Tax=Rhizobium ruizarguesonis TaxID=2081791 RepID=UPI0010310B35|nr:TIR domain-containing protein [Rhizobium ruizarguesonis]TBA34793.1 TIR domain-containing protein [Rhizobium ruizarguesonis]